MAASAALWPVGLERVTFRGILTMFMNLGVSLIYGENTNYLNVLTSSWAPAFNTPGPIRFEHPWDHFPVIPFSTPTAIDDTSISKARRDYDRAHVSSSAAVPPSEDDNTTMVRYDHQQQHASPPVAFGGNYTYDDSADDTAIMLPSYYDTTVGDGDAATIADSMLPMQSVTVHNVSNCDPLIANDIAVIFKRTVKRWNTYEAFVQRKVVLDDCQRNRYMTNGNVRCVNTLFMRNVAGHAVYWSRWANVNARYIRRLRREYPLDVATRRACLAALIAHELSHTCGHGEPYADALDTQAFKFYRRQFGALRFSSFGPCFTR